MMFALTRSNLLRQLPDLNEIIRRLTIKYERKRINRNIFMETAIECNPSINPLPKEVVKDRQISFFQT